MPVFRTGVADAAWDDALRAADGHFLQTRGWQQVQERLGAAVLHSHEPGEWLWTAHRGGSWPNRYIYAPAGPTVIDNKAMPACFDDLRAASRRVRAIFARVEPVGHVDFFALADGAKQTRSIQPQYTWILDITTDEEMLRRGLTKGHRSSINQAPRKNIVVRRATDPDDVMKLVGLLALTSARSGFHTAGEGYFRAIAETLMPQDAACLYLAEVEGSTVAAALGFDFNGVRHYAHAGADPAVARQLSAAAPLVWQMILDARADGMHTFDFWGVLPKPKPKHPWAGFTQFKQSFGGRLVERVGTWEVSARRKRHWMHRTARTVSGR